MVSCFGQTGDAILPIGDLRVKLKEQLGEGYVCSLSLALSSFLSLPPLFSFFHKALLLSLFCFPSHLSFLSTSRVCGCLNSGYAFVYKAEDVKTGPSSVFDSAYSFGISAFLE